MVVKDVSAAKLSATDRIYTYLEERIFSEVHKPGDRLREAHLARDLQVSQSTVREALIRLENYGLVVRVANRYTMITKLSNAEIRERLSIRISLEALAALEASRRMREEDFAVLEARLKALVKSTTTKDVWKWNRADLDFHRCIWDLSGNQTLSRTLNYLTSPLFAFVSIVRKRAAQDRPGMSKPHQPIVDAIAQGNPELIYNAIYEHIATSYDDFLTSNLEIHRTVSLGRR